MNFLKCYCNTEYIILKLIQLLCAGMLIKCNILLLSIYNLSSVSFYVELSQPLAL